MYSNNKYKCLDLNDLNCNLVDHNLKINNINEIFNDNKNINLINNINNSNNYRFEFKYQYKRPSNKITYEKIKYQGCNNRS